MRPRLTRTILILASLALAGCGEDLRLEPWQPGSSPKPPHVLMISIDSLRPDHLGCYGYVKPTSPAMDRLAAEGVRFEVALSTTSWTLPAHAALFTGLFDSTHGVTNNNLALGAEQETLTERLHARGYETIGFFGGPYLDAAFGFAQGFDHYESCMSPIGEHAHADVTGPRTLAAVEKRLERLSGRPLFCFVHLWDVHYDYKPPAETLALFSADDVDGLDLSGFDSNPAIHKDMSPRVRDRLIALYDAEIRSVDSQVERLVELTRKAIGDEDLLIVITADHGEEFFEHGKKGHQSSLFEEQVRIPMILVRKGVWPSGRSVAEPVSITDLAPTLAAAAGAQAGWRVQGRDLAGAWNGSGLVASTLLLELLVDRNDWRAVRTDKEKVMRARLEGGDWEAGYHLLRDPRERRSIGREEAWVVQGLERLQERLEDGAIVREKLGLELHAHSYSPELRQRLGFLGYTDSGTPSAPEKK